MVYLDPEKAAACKRRMHERGKSFFRDALNHQGCFLCGECERDFLQLHHVFPRKRKNAPNTINVALDELPRGLVLCANCHLQTHRRNRHLTIPPGYWKFLK